MKKYLNINTVLIGLVVILVAWGLSYRYFSKEQGAVAQVNFDDGRQPMEISLEEDKIYHIETENYPVTLEVKDGRIRFIDSKCPDHLCENFGFISSEGETAICMPAGVAVIVG